ncbi:MAG: trypsin-like peptidase domain-containing protein [Nitrososphaeraceae archaeon]|nr:trypsin-like peptidase domain-containing protein [Nitrososphaeraceae archaeon]
MNNKRMSEKKTMHTNNALVSLSKEIEYVADKVSQSVVSVRSRTRGNGSGVIWDSDGHIVTCNHIVRKLDNVEVSLNGDSKSYLAKVVGNDPYSDIAVLKIETNDIDNIPLKPIEIGDSENLKAGQFVLALANPYGQYPSITQGIITSERRSLGGAGWWWWASMTDNIVVTDARLNPGYSGGPLVDVEGKMIGLNAAYISSRGIAIRVIKVTNIADQLARDGAIKKAYIGIVTDEIHLPHEIGTQLEPSQDKGLLIISVENDTPAKEAGLLIGDIIVKFDNDPITNILDLRRQLLKQDVIGKPVKLTIIRSEKKSELTVTPQEASRSG